MCKRKTRGPRTLALCLTAAVGMTLAIFCRVQTGIKNSLLQTKSIEIWVNSHTVPHFEEDSWPSG